ncbi:MAG: cell division protein FtsA [Bacteroidetes bacterium GWC2_33_15]|nr:MAG: cell division protein FtsA [Bacteroidetes bacterium GWA2_33_15]OFX51260.1 MAG: cell division protein FtsA [Bacteroidetes bacterium GWC2_33_15]OFX66370.1 MAG: cell division protein FtsA [Bacteroidetes bacterium GWB2_32_14]OFX70663.1 MAG: cell division protein FtsA [Bacteroidetes bacterium GWD2_33_33]HAN20052.1 cell division protein FtsA [Bacteroidales bacterium]
MKPKTDFVAAIDIGTTKIVAIVGRKKENGKIEILGLSKTPSKGVKRGIVLNIEEAVNSIQKTVEDIQFTIGDNISDVFVGIAGQHIKSIKNRGYINRNSYDDIITKADIDALIQDMYKIPIDVGEEIIHVLPQNFIVDNETGVKNPVGMYGKRVEANFQIVVGQIASARNIGSCITKAGLHLNQLILEPLASSEAVLTPDEKEAGVALVDIGGGTTDIAVYYDDIIRHTAVIPLGGDVITNDIKEGCSILQRQAELLKIQYGSALGDLAKDEEVVSIPGISGREPKEISCKSLAYIIQSRMEEILNVVIYEIENSGYFEKLSAGIVITGGGALLKHLPALVKFKTGLDVRVGYPTENLASDTINEVNHPMYATGVGLILKGYEYLEKNNSKKQAVTKVQEKPVKQEIEFEEEKIVVKADENTNDKPGLFNNLKKVFTDIFDEDGAEM